MNNKTIIRNAEEKDISAIFSLIKELAEYEKLSDQIKTSEIELKKVLFGEDRFVEILIAEYDGTIAGQALFFKNFSLLLDRFKKVT